MRNGDSGLGGPGKGMPKQQPRASMGFHWALGKVLGPSEAGQGGLGQGMPMWLAMGLAWALREVLGNWPV